MFLNPSQILGAFDILPGQKIADFGAGTGFFTKAISQRVGEKGKVYAVEVQENIFLKLKEETKRLGNVESIHGDIEVLGGTHIRDSLIDTVLIANVMFQMVDKDGCINEIKRILKPGGRVVVIDWTDSFGNMGPRPEMIFGEMKARTFFESKGFKFVEKVSAGAHHYGIIFTYER